MRALSIRQPYAELILRGIKTVEYRTQPTNIIGERFHIYAAGKKWTGAKAKPIWLDDLRIGTPPAWMIELANALKLTADDDRSAPSLRHVENPPLIQPHQCIPAEESDHRP